MAADYAESAPLGSLKPVQFLAHRQNPDVSTHIAVLRPVAGRSTPIITMGQISATMGDVPISFDARATDRFGSRRYTFTPLLAMALKNPPNISAAYQP